MKELVQVNVNLSEGSASGKPTEYMRGAATNTEADLDAAYQGFISLFNSRDDASIDAMDSYLHPDVEAHAVRKTGTGGGGTIKVAKGLDRVKSWFLLEYQENAHIIAGTRGTEYEVEVNNNIVGSVDTKSGQYHTWTDDKGSEQLQLKFSFVFTNGQWLATRLRTK